MKRVLLFCGSLQSQSANLALLRVAEEALSNLGVTCDRALGLESVPALNPERSDDAPVVIEELRKQLGDVDGVLIACPEYAGGVAGHMKNTLDWMVGTGDLYRKPVALISAGTSGGRNALAQLSRTLTWQGAYVVATLGVMGPKSKSDADGNIVDAETLNRVSDLVGVLKAAMETSREDVVLVAKEVAKEFGYDPDRVA